MATQPETRLKIRAMQKLGSLPECWFVKTQFVAHVGIPDIIGCYRGRFFAWELKTNKGQLSKIQKYILDKIDRAGGHIAVVRPRNLDHEFEELKKTTSA